MAFARVFPSSSLKPALCVISGGRRVGTYKGKAMSITCANNKVDDKTIQIYINTNKQIIKKQKVQGVRIDTINKYAYFCWLGGPPMFIGKFMAHGNGMPIGIIGGAPGIPIPGMPGMPGIPGIPGIIPGMPS